ncbi:MAG: Hpt domain-containing protein, partial [Gammaproteobacteria bacterium]|nr:Hpt domain-containing protein [Gammaproteobacteria bacterium]
DDMEEAFAEVFQTVFNSIGASIEQLQQQPTDGETIVRLFHSIKSPAASLGAEQLAALAAEYEQLAKADPFSELQQRTLNLQRSFRLLEQELENFNHQN